MYSFGECKMTDYQDRNIERCKIEPVGALTSLEPGDKGEEQEKSGQKCRRDDGCSNPLNVASAACGIVKLSTSDLSGWMTSVAMEGSAHVC